jgi:prepilin signal peptidase PulO-like enzyme (type II secretory pathway)
VVDIDPLRVGGGIILMALASYQDLRRRQVDDRIWGVLGLYALALVQAEIWSHPAALALQPAVAAIGLLYFDALWDRKALEGRPMTSGFLSFILYMAVALLLLLGGAAAHGSGAWDLYLPLLAVAAMIVLAYVFYSTGVFKGGADAKAFMGLAFLFPSYPVLGPIPLSRVPVGLETLELLFPFVLTILLNGALVVALVPLALLIFNATRGHLTFPEALFGFKASLEDPPRFVWWMEDIGEGRWRLRLFPRRGEDPSVRAEQLRAAGMREAWATPQIPFILALALGLCVAVTVGNLLLALIAL